VLPASVRRGGAFTIKAFRFPLSSLILSRKRRGDCIMFKRVSTAAVTASCLMSCLTTAAMAEIRTMVCYISGRQEVPANASLSQGCGRFVIDTDANTVSYRITRSPFATN